MILFKVTCMLEGNNAFMNMLTGLRIDRRRDKHGIVADKSINFVYNIVR